VHNTTRIPQFFDSPNRHLGESSSPLVIDKLMWGYRRIPLSHGRHHTGHTIPWPGAAALPVESVEERLVLKALAARAECIALSAQPFTIWYTWAGRFRRYTPDFLAVFGDVPSDLQRRGAAQSTVIEVRPKHRIRMTVDAWEARQQAVWTAVRMPLVLLSADTAKEDRR
jgi:hypothetical protein